MEGETVSDSEQILNFYACMELVFTKCPAYIGKDSFREETYTSLPCHHIEKVKQAQYFALISLIFPKF